MTKYAIAMLIFGNENYITGSIISAYLHKQYINKYNLDIDLIVMVDDLIYKYKDELLKFFDKVKKINLIEMKLSNKYYVIKKYSKWMKFSINKWQIMQYEEYKKILFLDADFFPLDKKFYEIFNFNTPAVTTNLPCEEGEELLKTFFMNEKNINELSDSAETFNDIAKKLQSSINATVIMLEPNKSTYEEYINFIRKAEKKGYESLTHSGIDETTLLLFFRYYKDQPIYCIPKKFSIAPWDDKDYDINNIYGLNYVSFIKPWLRLPMLQWSEENIWHIVAKKALKKSEIITKIYVNGLLENLVFFANNYKNFNNKSGFNLEILQKYKNKFYDLLNIIDKNKHFKYENKKDIHLIKKIMISSKNIHSFMNHKSLIKYDNILKLINKS